MTFSAPLALLLLGIGAIVWGTKIALDNAIAVARHHKLSDFFIGVVVLAVGSDLPELVVSVDAALRQLGGVKTENLIIGNALGSCFGQLGLVVGVTGLLGKLALPRAQLLRHGGVLLAATVLLAIVGFDGLVTRLEGALLVAAFAAYVYFVIHEEGVLTGVRALEADEERPPGPIFGCWLRLFVGLAIVVASAELIVRAAMSLAAQWGVDQAFIGIAIIGIGTSLPEVVISVGAVLRKRVGLTVGNLIGSNILDTLLPIGIAALIVPLGFSRSLLTFDLLALFAFTSLVLGLFLWRGGIRWPQALVVLVAYLAYLFSVAPGS